tara:strand:+ start:6869 stop:7078 length:210 start_codon:yes stop_codon:yes gene_type:complete
MFNYQDMFAARREHFKLIAEYGRAQTLLGVKGVRTPYAVFEALSANLDAIKELAVEEYKHEQLPHREVA